ncbi:unnamed protein product [Closterium sp. NIES-53]
MFDTGTGGTSSGGAGARGAGTGGASSGSAGAGGAGTGGANFGGAGAGGAGTGDASSRGAGAGGVGAIGADTEETGAGGSPSASPIAPPHHHDTRFQALRRLEREEQEHRFPPRARPSSPLADLRTILFRSPPRRSPPVSVLPSLPDSSLTVFSHPVIDYYRAARLVVSRVLASLVTDPRASPSFVSALTAAVADFASTRRLDYTRVMAALPPYPLSVGGEARSTGTYVDAVPPPGANVVNGMWLFKMKRPPGSPPVFKARYVARGFNQHEGFDFFQTFASTPKMTTLRVLLHIAAQRDYELHSLDFSTAFLQGRRHEEIWLRRPPDFTDTFPPGTQWSLRRPVYGLRQSPLYVDDLDFATVDMAALTEVKSELQKRHKSLPFGFQFSTTQPTPLTIDHRLTGPFPDEPFESNLAFPLSVLSHFVATGRYLPIHWTAAVRVVKYLATTSGMGLVLGGAQPVVLTGHCDSAYADDVETQRSTQGYCFSLGVGAVSWRSTRSSSVASSNAEAEIYAGAMAA